MKLRAMSWRVAALLAAFTLLTSAVSHARPGGAPGGPNGPRAERKSELDDTVDSYRVQRMHDFLGLSDEQTAKILGVFGELRKARRTLREERRPLLERLHAQIESESPDEKEIRSILGSLENAKARHDQAEERSRRSLLAALTPIQQAKFIFFQERFEKDLREKVQQFREGRRERFAGPGRAPAADGEDK